MRRQSPDTSGTALWIVWSSAFRRSGVSNRSRVNAELRTKGCRRFAPPAHSKRESIGEWGGSRKAMARFKHPLDQVQVAAPCKADWEQMIGSERMRFCGACNLNVYNLSGMTRFEAESLIARNEGRLCVRFYRRLDGSIITKDCPVGLRAIQRRVSCLAKAILAAALTFLASIGVQSLIPGFPPPGPQVTTGVLALPNPAVVGLTVVPEDQLIIMGRMVPRMPQRRLRKVK